MISLYEIKKTGPLISGAIKPLLGKIIDRGEGEGTEEKHIQASAKLFKKAPNIFIFALKRYISNTPRLHLVKRRIYIQKVAYFYNMITSKNISHQNLCSFDTTYSNFITLAYFLCVCPFRLKQVSPGGIYVISTSKFQSVTYIHIYLCKVNTKYAVHIHVSYFLDVVHSDALSVHHCSMHKAT